MGAFECLHDRPIPVTSRGSEAQGDVTCFAACCPAMDLVAIAGAGQVSVQRSITWERLFSSATLQGLVRCLAWRPDGKALALGLESGAATLFDVEDGEPFALPKDSKPHRSPISSMHWASEKTAAATQNSTVYMDRSGLLPGAGVRRRAEGHRERREDAHRSYAAALMDTPLFGVDSSQRTALEILASGDEEGVITMSAFGYFPVGCADLSGAFSSRSGSELASVRQLRFSDDLSMLLAVLRRENEFRVVTVDTSLVSTKCRATELRHVTAQCGHVGEHISNIDHTMQEAQKRWEDGISTLENHLKSLQKHLQNFERPNTPEQELFLMLTCGVTSSALQAYVADLHEPGISKMGKSLDSCCVDMQDHVGTMYRSTQALVFRLHDLVGLAEWTQHFSAIGLQQDRFQLLLELAQELLLKLQELLTSIHGARANFAALSVWLQTVCRNYQIRSGEGSGKTLEKHIAHVDTDRLVDLLSRNLLHTHIGMQFKDHKLANPTPSPIYTSASEISTKSLCQAYTDLKSKWNQTFHMISETVSASFRPVDNIRIDGGSDRRISIGFEKGLFFTIVGSENKLRLLTKVLDQSNPAGLTENVFALADVLQIQDVATYKNGSIILTYIDSSEARCLGQVHLPLFGQVETLEISRKRILEPSSWTTCGLVSGPERGIAIILTTNRRLQLFDIENDEDEEPESN